MSDDFDETSFTSDSVTEVSTQSWFGKICESIKGVLFGLVLIPVSVGVLYWNESSGVKMQKTIAEGAANIISVKAGAVDPANNEKLIHVSGTVGTEEVLKDPLFPIAENGLRLSRTVEMFQWKETSKSEKTNNLGGGSQTTKTYSYNKTWSNKLIDSKEFKQQQDHQNPRDKSVHDNMLIAQHAKLGAFKVTPTLIGMMKGDVGISIKESDLDKLNGDLKGKAKLQGEYLYLSVDPANPAIGDMRITFQVLKPGDFSVVAKQVGDTFGAYTAQAGQTLERVEAGIVPASTMFQHAASENSQRIWIIRGIGFLVMSFGIGLILSPLTAFAEVIPFVGSIIEGGVMLAALVLGGVGSLLTVAVSWVVVRPVLGVTLIVIAVGTLVAGRSLGSKQPKTNG